jgi:hypothetical protein
VVNILFKKNEKNINNRNILVLMSYIDYLINYAKKLNDYRNKIYDEGDEGDEENESKIDKKTNEIDKEHYDTIFTQMKEFQNTTIDTFENSGVMIKKIENELRIEILHKINEFKDKLPVDYHPGSENKVRVIVHPSIYPLIKDKEDTIQNKFDFWGRPYENSKYQWLPSDVEVNETGKCKFLSYINNIPKKEKELYSSINNLLQNVIPYFEECLQKINNFKLYEDDDNFYEKKVKNIITTSLRGKTIQVITKIVKISLKNKESILGAWHVEGMSHENIIATATCTLEQTDKFDANLYFKRVYNQEEGEKLLYGFPQDIHRTFPKFGNLVTKELLPVGKISIKQGDIIVFPNLHVHKIDMKTDTKTEEESRTLLVFWLINPDVRITSTKDIKQQKYKIDKAHQHRLQLMEERKFYKQTFNQRDLNLCEH